RFPLASDSGVAATGFLRVFGSAFTDGPSDGLECPGAHAETVIRTANNNRSRIGGILQLPSSAEEGKVGAAGPDWGGAGQKTVLLINTTPAPCGATPPQLRRGVALPLEFPAIPVC